MASGELPCLVGLWCAIKNIVLKLIMHLSLAGFVWTVFMTITLVMAFLLMAVMYLFFEPDFEVVFKWLCLPLSILMSVCWISNKFSKIKNYVEGA
jgi:hypothetical protein